MIKNIKLLFIALIVQAILVAIVLLGQSQSSSKDSDTEFLAVDFEQVDRIEISDKDNKTIVAKVDGVWKLPNYGNLTAEDTKINDLITGLGELKKGWPVATTESAAKRFEVDSSNAQKTLVFYKGDSVGSTLYLGTSPGYRKIHARINDESEIYSVEFAQHKAPAKHDDWFDKALLSLSDDVSKVKTDAFEISKDGDNWLVTTNGQAVDQAVDYQAVTDWADKFKSLRVSNLVNENVEKITVQDPKFVAHVTGGGKKIDFAFYESAEKLYVKHFGDKRLFEIAGYQANPIIDIEVTSFFKEKPSDAESADASAPAVPVQGMPTAPK